jgi:hypothetical protein
MSRRITATVKNVSARLKTGNVQMEIKSLTPPSRILSIKFPKVHAIKRLYSPAVRCFFWKR